MPTSSGAACIHAIAALAATYNSISCAVDASANIAPSPDTPRPLGIYPFSANASIALAAQADEGSRVSTPTPGNPGGNCSIHAFAALAALAATYNSIFLRHRCPCQIAPSPDTPGPLAIDPFSANASIPLPAQAEEGSWAPPPAPGSPGGNSSAGHPPSQVPESVTNNETAGNCTIEASLQLEGYRLLGVSSGLVGLTPSAQKLLQSLRPGGALHARAGQSCGRWGRPPSSSPHRLPGLAWPRTTPRTWGLPWPRRQSSAQAGAGPWGPSWTWRWSVNGGGGCACRCPWPPSSSSALPPG